MKSNTSPRLWRSAAAVLATLAAVVGLVSIGPVASASPSTNTWAGEANKVCRSASDQYFDLTAPDGVLHETTATDGDMRAAGEYYDKVGRLYKSAAGGLKRLGSPSGQAKPVAAMIKAFDVAAAADHRVFIESRSGRAQPSEDDSRFARTLTDADQKVGQAGQQARTRELEECVILFDGGTADHQGASIGASADQQCGNVDPSFFSQDSAMYNPQFVPCTESHNVEQYATTEYPAGPAAPFPGDNQLGRFGDDLCGARFTKFVGVDPSVSTLDYTNLIPDSDQWDGGDHSIYCVLFDTNYQPLTGSMKDSRK
ncbi:MAG TPA: septum formation family protein [Gemmataceae bacterium]|nr:septum formation family protein [Gemmataceae bacterium]